MAPEASAPMRARLLTAEEPPGFDDDFTWTTATTRTSEGRKPFGTCHKFAMTSIGAGEVAVRTFTPRRRRRRSPRASWSRTSATR